MRSYVTGATGFIGRRLTEKLLLQGVRVTALVRNGDHRLPGGVEPVSGDILEPSSLGDFGRDHDRLYHLAAKISFDFRDRKELTQINGRGTANILAAARRWKIPRTVVVSSACTMGITSVVDQELNEMTPLDKSLVRSNPYMASKLSAEKMARRFAKEQNVVIVNPTTVYGPGDYSLNSGTLVKKLATSSLVPVPPGGSNVVDVDDVVCGIMTAGEAGKAGQRYILGGENLLFSKIFETICQVTDKHPAMIPLPVWMRRPLSYLVGAVGSITRDRLITPQIISDTFAFKYYSSQLAKQELDWQPHYTFSESIQRAWEFYRRQKIIS